MGASYAVGVVRGGRLLLAPLDQVMQLRPSLAHLDRGGGDRALTGAGGEAVAADERASGAGPAMDAMDEDDADGTEMEPVRVCFPPGVDCTCAGASGLRLASWGARPWGARLNTQLHCNRLAAPASCVFPRGAATGQHKHQYLSHVPSKLLPLVMMCRFLPENFSSTCSWQLVVDTLYSIIAGQVMR